MFDISPLSSQFSAQIQQKIDLKTKPLGALGQLEKLAKQIASIQSQQLGGFVDKLKLTQPNMLVFAGDHGIAQNAISIAPSEVTQQMVGNFAQGGAAINVFAKQSGWQLTVVDAGILSPVDKSLGIVEQRLGSGTSDFSKQAAMTTEQVQQGLEFGKTIMKQKFQQGSNLVAFGEMGIGNTSSASAIMATVLGLDAIACVGAGTGINEQQLVKKQQLVQQGLELHQLSINNPLDILAKVGGFEIAQICGAMLAAAERNMLVVVDGFICTAAAMIAKLINENVSDYFVFAHCSGEQGHQRMLAWFGAQPLLSLGMRLGEGSGAALCLPLIQAAVNFYNDMASFEQASVEDVVSE